jgi:hypothetical protein
MNPKLKYLGIQIVVILIKPIHYTVVSMSVSCPCPETKIFFTIFKSIFILYYIIFSIRELKMNLAR